MQAKVWKLELSRTKSVALLLAAMLSSGILTGCDLHQNHQNHQNPPTLQASQAPQSVRKHSYANQVDVLFVVDTSGSMSKFQKALADQVGQFVEALNKTGLDYQIAVTTMDMSESGEKGRFLADTNNPAILNQSTPDLSQVLAKRMFIGDADWHPQPRAFEAVKAGILASNTATGVNSGFLRKNAFLNLVFLSIKDDKSAIEDFKGWLDKLRPPPQDGGHGWVAQFIGVTSMEQSCRKLTANNGDVGRAYVELAKRSGGNTESICETDLRQAVANVGARLLEVVSEYRLVGKPIVANDR